MDKGRPVLEPEPESACTELKPSHALCARASTFSARKHDETAGAIIESMYTDIASIEVNDTTFIKAKVIEWPDQLDVTHAPDLELRA